MILTREQKEELRKTVLRVMADRHPAALSVRQIWSAAKRDLDFLFEQTDVTAVCEFLKGVRPAPFALCTEDPLGASKYWSATSAGVLHAERHP